VWWIKDKLDADLMRSTAAMFVGMHNFQSFTADDPEEKSTKALIEELRVEEFGNIIAMRVRGSHFLWNMVRRMVGVIAEVGRGKLPQAEARSFLHEASDIPAKLTAPPSGLFLERVYYRGDAIETDFQPTLRC
jgi:tRNA pseudouridine38-40 synthase